MACEKHRDALTDLALGELNSKRELELLSHAGECDACRESYAHAQAVREGIDRGIGALVAGEPSPHFASRLRARIAAEPDSVRPAWLAWAPIALGALALTALLVAVRIQQDVTTNFASTPPVVAKRPEDPARTSALKAPTTPVHVPRVNRRAASRLASAIVPVSRPDVLVPPGQLAAALMFTEALPTGHVDAYQLAASFHKIQQPLEVQALTVPPLEKPVPLDESAEYPGGL